MCAKSLILTCGLSHRVGSAAEECGGCSQWVIWGLFVAGVRLQID